jgi:hypothetical protein
MSSASAEQVTSRNPQRFPSYGDSPSALADIYEENINIAIWQRTSSELLDDAVTQFLAESPQFKTAMTVSPDSARAQVSAAAGGAGPNELVENVGELVEMFCDLFGLRRAGLRFATLDRAMCPKFHVDRVPCRLVTTYHGVATEWLPHRLVDRSKLGAGSKGQSDLDSGLFADESDIRRLSCGDVALLKGELWAGNEDAGLVHRSPAVTDGENRLLLSLDFSD